MPTTFNPQTPLKDLKFAVIDLETTGLFASRDRVIEIAIISLPSTGSQLSEYDTLINPNRDIGSRRIHGLFAKDVAKAPLFEHVAGDILERLAGRILVGHNFGFDMNFLESEFNRLEIALPDVPTICTMQLSRKVDPDVPARNLESCCLHFEVPPNHWHSALGDARATAALFSVFISRLQKNGAITLADLGVRGCFSGDGWPDIRPSGMICHRPSLDRAPEERSYLGQLVTKTPVTPARRAKWDPYFAVLDRALEDRHLRMEELMDIYKCAEEAGLTREEVDEAHFCYLSNLLETAFEDGVISPQEDEDLESVRDLLEVPRERFRALRAEMSRSTSETKQTTCHSLSELSGKSVCFTGECVSKYQGSYISRETAEELAETHGLIVKSGVSKKCDILVAADPDSMSGKAKKARLLGIPILPEVDFWNALGISVQ